MDMRHEIVLETSAAAAWQLLGEEFADIATWSASLAASSIVGDLGVGGGRVCEGLGFGPFPPSRITETLTQFDREEMALTYVATEGLPPFVRRAENRWTVEALAPHRCRVHMHATVSLVWWARPVGFLLPNLLARDVGRFVDELRHRAEEGVPHPRNRASGA